jgi:hypothetical protein
MGVSRQRRDDRGRFASGGGVAPPRAVPVMRKQEAEVLVDGKLPLRAESLETAMKLAEQFLDEGVEASVQYPASDVSATERLRSVVSQGQLFRFREPVVVAMAADERNEAVELVASTEHGECVGFGATSGDVVRVDIAGMDSENLERVVGTAQRVDVNGPLGVRALGKPWSVWVESSMAVSRDRAL